MIFVKVICLAHKIMAWWLWKNFYSTSSEDDSIWITGHGHLKFQTESINIYALQCCIFHYVWISVIKISWNCHLNNLKYGVVFTLNGYMFHLACRNFQAIQFLKESSLIHCQHIFVVVVTVISAAAETTLLYKLYSLKMTACQLTHVAV